MLMFVKSTPSGYSVELDLGTFVLGKAMYCSSSKSPLTWGARRWGCKF